MTPKELETIREHLEGVVHGYEEAGYEGTPKLITNARSLIAEVKRWWDERAELLEDVVCMVNDTDLVNHKLVTWRDVLKEPIR